MNKEIYKFKRNGFSFNYEIETDGYTASLNFINNSDIQNKINKKANFKKGRNETHKQKELMVTEEFEKRQDKKKQKEKDKIKNNWR